VAGGFVGLFVVNQTFEQTTPGFERNWLRYRTAFTKPMNLPVESKECHFRQATTTQKDGLRSEQDQLAC